jgi:hypothetical protein
VEGFVAGKPQAAPGTRIIGSLSGAGDLAAASIDPPAGAWARIDDTPAALRRNLFVSIAPELVAAKVVTRP